MVQKTSLRNKNKFFSSFRESKMIDQKKHLMTLFYAVFLFMIVLLKL